MKKLFISVLLFTLALPISAKAGWRVVQQDTSGGQSSDSILYMEGKKMRAEIAAQNQVLLIDAGADRLVIIDNKAKEYGEIRLSEFIGQIKSALEAVKAIKAQLPPELAKEIPDMSMDFKISFEPTGKKETISGFAASEFTAKDTKGKEVGVVWLSKEGKMGKLHADLMAFSKQLGQELAILAPVLNMAQEHGFPVKMHLLQQNDTYNDSIVKTIEEKPLKAAIFAVPPAYKQKNIEEFIAPVAPNLGASPKAAPEAGAPKAGSPAKK